MKIITQELITAQDVENNKDTHLYVFGDNEARQGYGGQAAELRPMQEKYPNVVFGIPTLYDPSKPYSDETLSRNLQSIRNAVLTLKDEAQKEGKIVVFPLAGVGSGIAALAINAPNTYKGMNKIFKQELGIFQAMDESGATTVKFLEDAESK